MLRITLLAGFLLLALTPREVSATIMTFDGSDLFTDPNVSFPTTSPTLDGTSLIFGAGTEQFEKLFVLPIISAGSLSSSETVTISVMISLTRLQCSSDPLCSGNENDFDPQIMLGDGSELVGGMASDNNGGQGLSVEMVDGGDVGTSRNLGDSDPLFFDAGYPSIGESFEVELVFTLEDTFTTVDLSFLGSSGSFTSSIVLDMTQDISLFFIRDNDIAEQYQINRVTIATPVPEPSSLPLLAIGLTGFGLMWRRPIKRIS